MAPGDFIGPYRILAEISRLPFSMTYLVEQPVQGTATPLFLTIWPDIHLRSPEEKAAFAQACQQIKGLQANAFPLLEGGVEQEAPYLLLPEQEASQKQVARINQQLQKSEPSAAGAVFLRAVQGVPSPRAVKTARWARTAREKGSRIPRRVWVGALTALLILSCCTWWVHLGVPASGATLTLAPMSMHVQQTLEVVVYAQPDQQGDILGRAITSTTTAQTRTGRATGKVDHAATVASGEVVISNITLNGSDSEDVGASTLTSRSGVDIDLDAFTARQGATITVPAHADQAGSRGNISANNINFSIVICAPYDFLCNSPVGHAFAHNPHAFTGGQNAFTQTVVQQSDINGLAQPLIDQLTPGAREQVSQQVAQHLQPGERAAMPAPQCTPTVKSTPPLNAAATTFSVSVTVTCYQLIYAQRDFLPGVIHAQGLQANSKYAEGYRLAGEMIAGAPVFSATDASRQTVTLQVKANSIWAYRADQGDQARMAEQIVGQTTDDAKALLLDTYSGRIHDVIFALEGFGGKLPTDARAIRIITQSPEGLHA
jgi:hypothetical protein